MFEIIQKIKEKVGLAFYLHPQTYEVSLEATLVNVFSKTIDYSLVIAAPSDSSEQRIIKGPSFLPGSVDVKMESFYGGRYVVFSGAASPGEILVFRMEVTAAIEPKLVDISESFRIADYSYIKKEIFERWISSMAHTDINVSSLGLMAEEAKNGASDVIGIVKNINTYVINRLDYGNPIQGLYTLNQTLSGEAVDCGGFDVLFVSLCHTLGIPARIVNGFWIGYRNNTMHSWAEVLLPNGLWLPVDPSIEKLARNGRTLKSGRIGFVGSDRLIVSYGSDAVLEVNGKKLIADILQNPLLISENKDNFHLSFVLRSRRL